MGGTSYPDPMTTPFEFGMLRQVLSVGGPLEGHTGGVNSVAYSPDGQRIISGSDDNTIRIWDAVTGVAVGKPLMGHTKRVWSVAYSPDGRRIISGSDDMTIRIWDAMTGTGVGNPPEGHTMNSKSIAHSPDGHHIVSASGGETTYLSDSIPHTPIPFSSSSNPIHPQLCLQPDTNGWVRDPEGGLLYWVPPDCRAGLHSPALLTIPLTSNVRSVSLDFTDFAFGTSWTQVFNGA
jgi:WD40 repeat protein